MALRVAQNMTFLQTFALNISKKQSQQSQNLLCQQNLEKVIELQNQDITARFWLCLIYHSQGNTEKAKNTFEYLKKFVYRLRVEIE